MMMTCDDDDTARRLVPDSAASPAGRALLADKRRADHIFTDARRQCRHPLQLEDPREWAPRLSETVGGLARELYSAARAEVCPTSVILAELEELAAVLAGAGLARGWAAEPFLRAGRPPREELVGAYCEIVEGWSARPAAQLLHVISSASHVLRAWAREAAAGGAGSAEARRELLQAARAGRAHAWCKQLRKHLSTLSTRALPAAGEQLYKEVMMEVGEVEQSLARINSLA
jgi:hypothetical protein